MNFKPSPRSDRKFFCGLCRFVKSWKAMLDGREKKYQVGIFARVIEALCRLDRVGSPTNPNWAINFFSVASLAVFSCQSIWVDSELICFVTAMEVCLCFFAWNRCFFRRLVLGFRGFVGFLRQSC